MQTEQILFKEFDYSAVPGKKRKPKGFLPGGRAKGEVPPPPPTFSQEELNEAKKEAHAQGFAEGVEEGKRQQKDAEADTQQALRQTLHNVCASFTPMVEEYKRSISQLRIDMPKVALAAAKKAAGKALDENATAQLNDIVERCLQTIPDKPEITITIHSSMADALKKHLEALAKTYPIAAQVLVASDETMQPSNCKVSWKDGAFLRDTMQIWQNIEQAIDQLSAGESFAVEKELEEMPVAAPPIEAPVEQPAQDTQEAAPAEGEPQQATDTSEAPEASDTTDQPPKEE